MNINSASAPSHESSSPTAGKMTVLIVDDSKVIRLALNKILKADFEVIQAGDGEEALTCLDENDAISAIFSDVSMPNLDGFGLLEKVRTSSEQRIAKLPFIIITANDDDDNFINKVKDAGGDDLITKPFKTNEIKACINKYISSDQEQGLEPELPLSTNLPDLDTTAQAEVAASASVADKPLDFDLSFDSEEDIANTADKDVAEILGFDLDDDLATTVAETTSEVDNDSASNGVEFTVSEDFFNEADIPSMDDPVVTDIPEVLEVPETGTVDHFDIADIDFETDEITPETSPAPVADISQSSYTAGDSTQWTLDDPAPTEAAKPTDELPLEFENEADVSIPPAVISKPEEIQIESPDSKKMQLEQARKRAMDIAREQVIELDDTATESKPDAIQANNELNKIREKLQKLRDQEIQDRSYQKDHDYSPMGKITSFFTGVVRIILRLFGIRKK